MEAIKQITMANAFSAEIATLATKKLSPKSESLYQHYWEKFRNWCLAGDTHPLYPSMPKIAEFFYYLAKERHVGYSCITNHRSAINSVLSLLKQDITEDETINNMLRALKRTAQPRKLGNQPDWSLSVVLESLRHSPYEPRARAGLREWTMKFFSLPWHRVDE